MDFFTQIEQFWLAVLQILYSIYDVLVNTTDRLDAVDFNSTAVAEYLGYTKYVIGTPLYSMFMTVILISIGVTVYKTFLKGIFLVKELLIKIGR